MGRLVFDENKRVDAPVLILCNRAMEQLGNVYPYEDLNIVKNLNSADEISFKVYKQTNGVANPIWDKMVSLRLVKLLDSNEYYEIKVDVDEEDATCKNVSGKSLCECELSQVYLFDLEINTESDIARSDYTKPTVFYNVSDKKNSLLHRVLSKTPNYKIGTVDGSLTGIIRSFSADNKTVYDFLSTDVAEEIGCLFLFDSATRTINVYDVENRCTDCGKRIGVAEVCPYCGSADIAYGYGVDTEVFVTKENLAQSLSMSSDSDSVKNCFRISGGDDDVTAAVINCNPNGSQYIYYCSNDQKMDMSTDLRNKLNSYDVLYNSKKAGFASVATEIYQNMDRITELTSTMMPSVEITDTTANAEVNKLTASKLSPVAIANLKTISLSVANNAVLSFAKIIVDSRYRTTISDSSLSGNSWIGKFTVENIYDDEDVATSSFYVTVVINDNQELYITQKIDKTLNDKEVEDKDYNWTEYCLDSLNNFHNAYTEVLAVMIDHGDSTSSSEFFEPMYVPYANKLQAIEKEIKVREKQIASVQKTYDANVKKRVAIQKELDFKKYLGDDLWNEFQGYRREQDYKNSNYVSTGLTSAELIAKAQELIDTATKDLITASRVQHSVSINMNNLLARQEFSSLWDKFEVGNWIRAEIDESIIKVRMISYHVNYSEIQNIDADFSDVVITYAGKNDLKSVLSQAQSMATSYDYVERQSEYSYKNANLINGWVSNGLDASMVKILNNAKTQGVTIDESGILCRGYNEETDAYDDEQMRIINNSIYCTDDNWKSTRSIFGKFYYTDPETGEHVSTYGIIASTLVGDLILGESLKITNANNTVTINEDGFRVTNGINTLVIDPSTFNMFQILKNGVPKLYIDTNGNIKLDGAVINWENGVNAPAYGQIDGLNAKFEQIDTEYLHADELDAEVANIIQLNAHTITSQYLNTVYLTAENADINYAKITELEATNAEIANLKSHSITTDYLKANYAEINLANIEKGCITTAMIGDEVVGTSQIADSSVTDGKIVNLTANKITAGTIDCGTIDVINLKAANITVGTINGQQISQGTIDMSNLNESITRPIETATENASKAIDDAAIALAKANEATDEASEAKISADGKSTVYRQSTEPTGGTYKTGDTWFNTSKGNAIYVYDGSNGWVPAELGAKALSSTVTNQITSAANTANSALTEAMKKSKTYHGNGSPDDSELIPSDLSDGDLWYDLLDPSHFYIWDSFSQMWLEVQIESTVSSEVEAEIEEAKKKAEEAEKQAEYAVESANGKNKTYVQGIAPDADKCNDGDTWFDSSNGNKIYTFNGTSWVEVAIGMAGLGTDVSSIINGAEETANKAMTSASGKSKVYRQSTTPVSDDLNAGDTWFNTSEDNKIYVWNGTSWDDNGFGSLAIKDGAIVDSKIANLDAGKITTGEIAAERIAAGSITFGKLDSDAVSSINALVNVGARNILGLGKYKESDSTIKYYTDEKYGIDFYEGGGSIALYLYSNAIDGKEYTLSFDFGNCSGSDIGTFYVSDHEPKSLISGKNSYTFVASSDTWEEYIHDGTSGLIKVYFVPSATDVRIHTVTNIKLESGTVATDYSPAPEDVELDIQKNGIGQWCYDNDLTFIDGGKIFTGTITAHQIAADTITADSAIIADAAITNAKIASLDAGKISTGYLNADRIEANSIGADKLVVGLGGNIYCTGYDTFSHITKGTILDNEYFSVTDECSYVGTKCLKIVTDNYEANSCLGTPENHYGKIPVQENKTYILSWYAKSPNTDSLAIYVHEFSSLNEWWTENTPVLKHFSCDLTNEWKRSYGSFKVSDGVKYVCLSVVQIETNTITYLDAIQIEESAGNAEPSSFKPAGISMIDGGQITAETITAKSIKAETITADKISLKTITSDRIADLAITGDKIAANSIDGDKLSDLSITSDKIVMNTITGDNIANATITGESLVLGTITGDKIAATAITGDKIATGTIEATNIKSGTITADSAVIADGAITNAKIGNLDASKITAGTIDAERIGAETITSEKLFVGDMTNVSKIDPDTGVMIDTIPIQTISGSKYFYRSGTLVCARSKSIDFKTNEVYSFSFYGKSAGTTSTVISALVRYFYSDNTTSVAGTGNITVGTTLSTYKAEVKISTERNMSKTLDRVEFQFVTGSAYVYFKDIYIRKMANGELIVDGSITTDKITSNAITTDKITSGAITADLIGANAVTANKILAGAINADKIAANSIQSKHITANAITSDMIVADAITAAKIAANSITANKILAGAITADKIEAGAVTTAKIDAGAVTATKISVSDLSALNATIGGWVINTSSIYSNVEVDGYRYETRLNKASSTTTYAMIVRKATVSSGGVLGSWGNQFYVRYDGKLYAKDAEIEGKITGKITATQTIESQNINVNGSVCIIDSQANSSRCIQFASGDWSTKLGYTGINIVNADWEYRMRKNSIYMINVDSNNLHSSDAGSRCLLGITSQSESEKQSKEDVLFSAMPHIFLRNYGQHRTLTIPGQSTYTQFYDERQEKYTETKNKIVETKVAQWGLDTTEYKSNTALANNTAQRKVYEVGLGSHYINIYQYAADGSTISKQTTINEAGGTGLAWVNSSSEALKTNIKPYSTSDALKIVDATMLYTYNYKSDVANGIMKDKYGFVIERETPAELVSNDGDGVDLYSISAMAFGAIQELKKQIEELKSEKATLKSNK